MLQGPFSGVLTELETEQIRRTLKYGVLVGVVSFRLECLLGLVSDLRF
jgi:hypothetical protein